MPTGYTVGIEDGKIKNGTEFLKVCSRAFGALIHMRDDPLSDEIKKAKSSDFYAKRLEETKGRLNELMEMSDEDVVAKIEINHNSRLKEYKEIYRKGEEKNKKYNKILAEVLEWIPPTPDHEKLKAFAIEQIKLSMSDYHIQYKDKTPEPYTVSEWRKIQTDMILSDIERYSKDIKKEKDILENRNKWIDDLLNSL